MSNSRTPKLSFAYGNMLRVNNKSLWANVLPVPEPSKHEIITPDQLADYLDIGRRAIEAVHAAMPEVFAVHLSTDEDTHGRESRRILTPEGWDSWSGIHDNPNMLVSDFAPYWAAVEAAGYTPRARATSGKFVDGVWLMLRRKD